MHETETSENQDTRLSRSGYCELFTFYVVYIYFAIDL